MQAAGDAMAWVTFIATLGFTILYSAIAPWWRTPIGRNMMAMSVAHLLVFALICANTLWGLDWAARPSVRFATFTTIAGIFIWRTAIFLREVARARKEKERSVEQIR